MQKPIQLIPCCRIFAQVSIVIGVIFLILALTVNAKAAVPRRDSSVAATLQAQLARHPYLKYPRSVERFYKQTRYKLAFIAPDTVKTHAWDAMLLLDCALHYGLSPNDYHPKELVYERLNAMMAKNEKVGIRQKANYDILLTDAMISMINNLHFGKLNPVYTTAVLDKGNSGDLRAVDALINCLRQKDFMTAIEKTQPVSKAYYSLQRHMRMITGQQALDCYEIPPGDVQIMAINMERLRWIKRSDSVYISINPPTALLKFHQKDTTYQFKAQVGTAAAPTPVIQTRITGVSINRGIVTFDLADDTLILTGMAGSDQRPGAVKIQSISKLAALVLKGNQADPTVADLSSTGYTKAGKLIRLKKPMPVRVTYLTCEVGEWGLVRYPDVYGLDRLLEKAFYQAPDVLAGRPAIKPMKLLKIKPGITERPLR